MENLSTVQALPELESDAESEVVTSSPFPLVDISRNNTSRLVECFTSIMVS